jgi:hypothetical protein
MVLDTWSIDPRRVLEAYIDTISAGKSLVYRLTVSLNYGSTIKVAELFFSNSAEAMQALKKLDKKAYKGHLADAISTDRLEDDDDDDEESGKIGFA